MEMFGTMLEILPLIVIFAIGFGLKQAKFLSSADGGTLLKLIFYVGAPALIFLSILHVDIDASLILLSLLAPCIVGITLLATYLLRRSWLQQVNPKTYGTLLIGSIIMNTGFLLPFVEKIYGVEGLARIAIIDVTGFMLTFGPIYAVAAKMGNGGGDKAFIVKKLLISPPLWAIILALVYKALETTPPTIVLDTLEIAFKLVAPVILLALGLKFTLRIKNPKLLIFPIVLRFGLGFAIGFLFVKVFGLEGLNAQIVLLASIAPIGFNSITFSELEKLDSEFAASQVSMSILIAIITMPLSIYLLQYV